jgi:hypothetical protein
MPTVPSAIWWHDDFDWNVANYAPITVGGALVLFGGWYLLSARHWFKGPVREGSEEELARMETGFGDSTPAAPAHGS